MSKEEELQELEDMYFRLNLVDTWQSEDYKLANELERKISKLKEEIKNDKENKERNEQRI